MELTRGQTGAGACASAARHVGARKRTHAHAHAHAHAYNRHSSTHPRTHPTDTSTAAEPPTLLSLPLEVLEMIASRVRPADRRALRLVFKCVCVLLGACVRERPVTLHAPFLSHTAIDDRHQAAA